MDNQTDIASQQAPQPSSILPQPVHVSPWIKVFLLLLFVAIPIGIGSYVLGTKKYQSKSPITTSNTQSITTPTSSLKPVYIGNYDVDVKISSDSPCNTDIYLGTCKSDVYLKDIVSGKETYIFTTNDVLRNDSRIPRYKAGFIFLVKRTGYDYHIANYQGKWTDELWVFTDKNQGMKIYDLPGFTYSINDDASLVAILKPNPSVSEFAVTLLSRNNNWYPKIYSLDSKCGANSELDLEAWQQNPQALWGVYASEYRMVLCYWKLDPQTSTAMYFPANGETLFALNMDKLVALYTDKPFFGDVDGYNAWKITHKTYSLYLYSLKTQKSIIIATFPSDFGFSQQDTKWISLTELQYLSPKGKVIYTLSN